MIHGLQINTENIQHYLLGKCKLIPCTPLGTAKVRNRDHTKCRAGMEPPCRSHTKCGTESGVAPLEKAGSFFQTQTHTCCMTRHSYPWALVPEKVKHRPTLKPAPNFTAAVLVLAPKWEQPERPFMGTRLNDLGTLYHRMVLSTEKG